MHETNLTIKVEFKFILLYNIVQIVNTKNDKE